MLNTNYNGYKCFFLSTNNITYLAPSEKPLYSIIYLFIYTKQSSVEADSFLILGHIKRYLCKATYFTVTDIPGIFPFKILDLLTGKSKETPMPWKPRRSAPCLPVVSLAN